MCERISDWYECVLPNGKKGIREEVSYLFCDDLWREIKSFLILPSNLTKGLSKCCPQYALMVPEVREKRKKIIKEHRPFHCKTGGYFLYDGFYLPPSHFINEETPRQVIIDNLNKEVFSSAIKSGIWCYFSNERARRREELLNQLTDAVQDLIDAVEEELLGNY